MAAQALEQPQLTASLGTASSRPTALSLAVLSLSMGPLQRVVGRLHLVRDLGRSQVSNKHTIQGLNCHRQSGGFLIGHVADFPGGVR
jgi:hypothetical protein